MRRSGINRNLPRLAASRSKRMEQAWQTHITSRFETSSRWRCSLGMGSLQNSHASKPACAACCPRRANRLSAESSPGRLGSDIMADPGSRPKRRERYESFRETGRGFDGSVGFNRQEVWGELMDSLFDRQLQGDRGGRTAMTTADQPQVRDPSLHTQKLHIAAMRFHVGSHFIQRLLDARLDTIRV